MIPEDLLRRVSDIVRRSGVDDAERVARSCPSRPRMNVIAMVAMEPTAVRDALREVNKAVKLITEGNPTKPLTQEQAEYAKKAAYFSDDVKAKLQARVRK